VRIFFLIFTFSVFAYANAQSVPLIAQLNVELDAGQRLPLGNSISFEFITSNPQAVTHALQNWQGISVDKLDNDSLLVKSVARPRFVGGLNKKYSLDSFVIDINEKSTQDFAAGFIKNHQKPFKLTQLEAYVDEYITKPTYVNGFNIASVVASQRSGDCTEYAVLLTALARSIELPARVIIGVVIIEEQEQVSGFGHAWVEVWFNEQWHILDAALYRLDAAQRFYLPAGELENEGPGYNMSLAKALILSPHKIRALRSAQ
jgi:transglutaminase-like putative cysteine protease